MHCMHWRRLALGLALLCLVAVVAVRADDDEGEPLADSFDDFQDDDDVTPEAGAGGAGQETVGTNPKYDDYEPPAPESSLFFETFGAGWEDRWQPSEDERFAEGEWEVGHGKQTSALPKEQGLFVKLAAKHHALSSKLAEPLDLTKGLVVSYEVRFHQHHECGGAYLKLLSHDPEFTTGSFTNDSPYSIMFGPDKCGANDKVHFIMRHQSPKTEKIEEKHLLSPPMIKNDRKTHLYTLAITPDNKFQLLVDLKEVSSGSLFDKFDPAINPPEEIDDPEDEKPEDWVEEAMMDDPEASKPDDWDEDAPATIPDPEAAKPEGWRDDEPLMIPDPDASKPEDWDDEMDGDWMPPDVENPACSVGCGEWTHPTIPNPDFKGKWYPPQIENPDYKGLWAPRKIPNPDYFDDTEPLAHIAPIGAVGIEIWTMQDGIEFDNVYLGHDLEACKAWAQKTWGVKHEAELDMIARQRAVDAANGPSYLEQAQRLFEEYPAVVVVGLILLSLFILFLLTQCCVKDSTRVPDVPARAERNESQDIDDQPADVEEEETEVTEETEEETLRRRKQSKSPGSRRRPKRAD